MSPQEIAAYTLAFAKEYEKHDPGTIEFEAALRANRNVANRIAEVGLSAGEVKVFKEMLRVMSDAATYHKEAGGQPVVPPTLDVVQRPEAGGVGFVSYLAGYALSDDEEEESEEEGEEEEDAAGGGGGLIDRIRSRMQKRRKTMRRKLQRHIKKRRSRLAKRAKKGGFGSRIARGLLRLGDKIRARRQRRKAKRARRRARRRH
jgi:hypothetical protein